ncbi:MAG TPA: sigma-70 family RNA polymerase sigma factor [Candidatus Paceibacterota bacterium]|nr:sigma-70 family RNA polymerase sigma factor [Verrucomicrobiota bacterium]HOX01846.1 sigma-70 family RNA polymerase sigma factor [Verrucomicrobiota bacterium]HRZ44816.1 sigma-70 family RNA polymerase sigma factor [Candidatus Paceibacterota bacterium]
MDPDSKLIAAVLQGDIDSFESLIQKYQPRLFAMARRYARNETEVQDLVQEMLIKAYQRLGSFRGRAPFEHWLMRLAVRTCYDFLRARRRNRETACTDLSDEENQWLDQFAHHAAPPAESEPGARELIQRSLDHLPPPARLVIGLLEIEGRSVKEIAQLTGWSVPLVKVRAFRARRMMRKYIERLLRTSSL